MDNTEDRAGYLTPEQASMLFAEGEDDDGDALQDYLKLLAAVRDRARSDAGDPAQG